MKISEAFKVLKLLYEYPIISCTAIATEVNISIRSCYRYLEEFSLAGIPVQIKSGRYGGAYLSEEYKQQINTLGALIKSYASAS